MRTVWWLTGVTLVAAMLATAAAADYGQRYPNSPAGRCVAQVAHLCTGRSPGLAVPAPTPAPAPAATPAPTLADFGPDDLPPEIKALAYPSALAQEAVQQPQGDVLIPIVVTPFLDQGTAQAPAKAPTTCGPCCPDGPFSVALNWCQPAACEECCRHCPLGMMAQVVTNWFTHCREACAPTARTGDDEFKDVLVQVEDYRKGCDQFGMGMIQDAGAPPKLIQGICVPCPSCCPPPFPPGSPTQVVFVPLTGPDGKTFQAMEFRVAEAAAARCCGQACCNERTFDVRTGCGGDKPCCSATTSATGKTCVIKICCTGDGCGAGKTCCMEKVCCTGDACCAIGTCCAAPAPSAAPVVKVYPVAAVCPGSAGDTECHVQSLMALLTKVIEPASWQMMGGQGTLDYYAPARALVVRQTPAVHGQIADLLGQLGTMAAHHGQPPAKGSMTVELGVGTQGLHFKVQGAKPMPTQKTEIVEEEEEAPCPKVKQCDGPCGVPQLDIDLDFSLDGTDHPKFDPKTTSATPEVLPPPVDLDPTQPVAEPATPEKLPSGDHPQMNGYVPGHEPACPYHGGECTRYRFPGYVPPPSAAEGKKPVPMEKIEVLPEPVVDPVTPVEEDEEEIPAGRCPRPDTLLFFSMALGYVW